MEKSFRQLLKEYFTFPKKDRNGILFLGALILFAITGVIMIDTIDLNTKQDFTNFKKALKAWEKENQREKKSKKLFAFNPNTITATAIDSLAIPEFIKENILRYREAGGKFKQASDVQIIYGMNDSIFEQLKEFIVLPPPPSIKNEKVEKEKLSFSGTFDPNKANPAILAKFGFNDFQSSNLISYRENGGSFSQPGDVLKIYGIDSAFFSTVKKHIRIKEKTSRRNEKPETTDNEVTTKIQIELNSADTVDLIQLNGVGSIFALRIIKYRDLLGGFYAKHQLLEVYNFPEDTYNNIRSNILVDSLAIKKIRLNFAGYSEMLRHPYIQKEHVEKIISYREKNGSFKSIEQFREAHFFDSLTYRRVKHYLSCR